MADLRIALPACVHLGLVACELAPVLRRRMQLGSRDSIPPELRSSGLLSDSTRQDAHHMSCEDEPVVLFGHP